MCSPQAITTNPKPLLLFWQLFACFFKIGAFTLGGGYAMLPLIQQEIVDKRKWIDSDEFLELLALAQSAPGPIAVNTAVFVGYKLLGIAGVLATVLGSILPSFVIILVIAMYLKDIRKYHCVEAAFKALRPAVVALILVPVINNSKKFKKSVVPYAVAILSAMLVARFGVSPIYIIIGSALLGLCIGMLKQKRTATSETEANK